MARSIYAPISLFLLVREGDEGADGLGPTVWDRGLPPTKAWPSWNGSPSNRIYARSAALSPRATKQAAELWKKIGLVRDQSIEGALLMKATGERIGEWLYIWRPSGCGS
jgi:hypothetical protein